MLQFKNQMLFYTVAGQMEAFSSSLSLNYDRLVCGRMGEDGYVPPHRVVAQAINMYGGIICPVIYALAFADPTCEDKPMLTRIVNFLESVYDTAMEVAKWLRRASCSTLTYSRRFFINPRKLFSPNYFPNLIKKRHHVAKRREWIAMRLCDVYREFLVWLRLALLQIESQVSNNDPMRPVELGPYAREGIVHEVDRKKGFVILHAANARQGSQVFHILPGSNKAWEHIRALCETSDPEGYAPLPKSYAADFHRTDAGNESKDDDLARLLRHIVPGSVVGTYRLQLTTKPPLLRGQ